MTISDLTRQNEWPEECLLSPPPEIPFSDPRWSGSAPQTTQRTVLNEEGDRSGIRCHEWMKIDEEERGGRKRRENWETG